MYLNTEQNAACSQEVARIRQLLFTFLDELQYLRALDRQIAESLRAASSVPPPPLSAVTRIGGNNVQQSDINPSKTLLVRRTARLSRDHAVKRSVDDWGVFDERSMSIVKLQQHRLSLNNVGAEPSVESFYLY